MQEFRFLLNSMNLGLSLKDKLVLYDLVDPKKSNKINLPKFIETIEDKGLTDRALRAILEKFAVSLYFNDMSLKSAFEYFDSIDRDGKITPNEFYSGVTSLDLGVSVFETKQLMTLIDVSHDGYIDKDEFISGFERLFKKFEIDPSRDLSFSLYAKIHHLRTVKGKDLLEAFRALDIQKKGQVAKETCKRVFINFGFVNIKPYQISALLNLAQQTNKLVQLAPQSSNRGIKKLVKEKELKEIPEGMIQYEPFVDKLYQEVHKNLKLIIEATNDLLRKIYTIIQRKNLSLYEVFVLFDINNSNSLSRLEFKIGLQNLGINWGNSDVSMIWNSFDKALKYRINYLSFLKAFIEAGALKIINFDDTLNLLIKKFHKVIEKLGNYEEVFARFDRSPRPQTHTHARRIQGKM